MMNAALVCASVSTAGEVVSLGVGALELVLVAVLLRYLVRFGRGFPWLVALLLFFLARAIARLYETAASETLADVELALDAFVVLILVVLAAGLEHTVRRLRLALDEASFREQEYERALADYRRLARHRLANPLTAILGGVQALEHLADANNDTRRRLLSTIESEARRLQQVALEPEPLSPEEHGLRPKPDRVDRS